MKKYLNVLILCAFACLFCGLNVYSQQVRPIRVASDTVVLDTVSVVETQTAEGRVVTTTVEERNSIATNNFSHNWEISGSIGIHKFHGENESKIKSWTELITFPTVELFLTKWATPSFGLGAGISYSRFKGLYQSRYGEDESLSANYKTNELYKKADPKWDYMKLAYQRADALNIHATLHFDINSIFEGYNPERFYTAELFAGGGIILGFDKNETITSPTINFGFVNKFRIKNNLLFTVSLRADFIGDEFDGESFIDEDSTKARKINIKMDNALGLTVGLSIPLIKEKYKWHPVRHTSVVRYDDRYEQENRELVRELEAARSQVGSQGDTLVIKETPDVWFHINFDIDRWSITNREMVNLQSIAKAIQSTPGVRYLVCGYADVQTATAEHNLMLSERRAHAVYDVLTKELGVDPERLELDFKGGVDTMFLNNEELSRCVMVTPITDESSAD